MPRPRSPNVLSIQSSVVYGHVGNAAAAPALNRLGITVWPLESARLSNHTGHAGWRGGPVPAAELRALAEGLADLGALGRCDALLTGYLGTAATAEAAIEIRERLAAEAPGAIHLCDPVMGNAARGLYVAEDLPALFRDRLAPRADIVTPNRFELGLLTGRTVETVDDALAAAEALRARGPATVVCTSLPAPEGGIATLAVSGDGAWRIVTPRLDAPANGAGDLLAALFLGHLLLGRDMVTALARAVSSVHVVIAASAGEGSRDLALIANADALVAPPRLFRPERLR